MVAVRLPRSARYEGSQIIECAMACLMSAPPTVCLLLRGGVRPCFAHWGIPSAKRSALGFKVE